MGAVGFISQAQHPGIVGHPHNGAQVAADAVIGGVVDQNRHRVGVLGNGFGHLFPLHAQADAEPLVHFGVDIHRHSAAEHQCVQHAAVHVAGQDDLIPALAGGQHHALHRAGGAAHHQKRVGSAERIGGQFLRFADDGYRMAEIIQRLHAVHIHPNALLAQKGGQFRVAASPLMTGHIKGNHAHLAEIFQRFVDGGAALVQPGAFFLTVHVYLRSRFLWEVPFGKTKNASLTRVCRLAFETSFFNFATGQIPPACLPGERMRHDSKRLSVSESI